MARDRSKSDSIRAATTGADEPGLYSAENWSPDESVGYLLHQVRGRLVTAIDAELVPLGITWAQWSTLLYIANGKADTAADLSRHATVDTGSMTRMLDRLEQKGLIQRIRCAKDRRVVRLSLTEAGRELYPQLPPIAVKVLNRYLQGFSRDELESLKGFLRRILVNADER